MNGFWSYARADDTSNKVSKLRGAMEQSLGQAKGERVPLYQDKTSTNWGADWRKKIDDALAESDFFIAVLTPYYFNRRHCRYEFGRAVELAKPIFPIYYRTSELLESRQNRGRRKRSKKESVAHAARIAEKAASLQLRDFRKLRNKSVNSEESQDFIDKIAEELIQQF